MIEQAQAALARRDCASALAAVAAHGDRFPRGRLAEERDALRVQALTCAGHDAEARTRALEFQAAYPRSLLLGRANETGDGDDDEGENGTP